MSKTIPPNALIVIADGREAILPRNTGWGADVTLREERRLSPKDLAHDDPSGSRPEDQKPRQTDEATFAKQLAKTFFTMREAGDCRALVLFADPRHSANSARRCTRPLRRASWTATPKTSPIIRPATSKRR